MENEMLKTHPAVFAVGDEYQIMVCVKAPCLMWVKVGDEKFYDDSNGILRSNVTTHRMRVPAECLNEAKEYTVCWRKIIDRKPYFPETEEEKQLTYSFRPVEGEKTVMYHISDAHNLVDAPVAAARHFEAKYGKMDLLVLNGDIPNHSGKIEYFDNIYEIVSRLTAGEIPTVFSRGNHDLRGFYAETIAEYTPNWNGNTFYTVRVGDIWAIVMDCGEDKADSCEAYGYTICCHEFRKRQARWLKTVAAGKEFEDPSIKHRIVICHKPFSVAEGAERFNIEQDIYGEWCRVLKEEIHPDLMISGHFHSQFVTFPGDERDNYLGHPCPVAVGSVPRQPKPEEGITAYHAAAGFIFEQGKITHVPVDCEGNFFPQTVFEQ
ncbi:MAG: metallophosphoesterase [Clostridia bacterium]|nr:metallophosphoesterase [Clostridia bacterium]